jgi:hypothetical protein
MSDQYLAVAQEHGMPQDLLNNTTMTNNKKNTKDDSEEDDSSEDDSAEISSKEASNVFASVNKENLSQGYV